ncbi:hypothetical protein G7051_10935 [Dysgonomonas sp. HDW5B]|uniref:hypothetical protein n=1 Tax=Dysgonomonas sp. HDW5B TaxID=2714927 RepID=UPI0014098779|nr:hypothetical protein [Dysgonomonas sp. HDW5B]QIK54830.1 hypothetical protein G7051_10935 [Dysgonomonas sp. HDW5B]
MNDIEIPKTEKELYNWMKENHCNFDSYSINGNSIYEGFGIEIIGGLYTWFYTEKGIKNQVKTFQTEQEIIEYAYTQIKSDKWAWTHCIEFTRNKYKSDKLCHILTDMEIEYFQDEIPYYGKDSPVYRVFVLACDIKKTKFLKVKYYLKRGLSRIHFKSI